MRTQIRFFRFFKPTNMSNPPKIDVSGINKKFHVCRVGPDIWGLENRAYPRVQKVGPVPALMFTGRIWLFYNIIYSGNV